MCRSNGGLTVPKNWLHCLNLRYSRTLCCIIYSVHSMIQYHNYFFLRFFLQIVNIRYTNHTNFFFPFQDVRCWWQWCDWSRRNDQDCSSHLWHAWRRRHETYGFSWGKSQEYFFADGRKWRWSSDRRRIPQGLPTRWRALQNVGAKCGPIMNNFSSKKTLQKKLQKSRSIFTIIFLHNFFFYWSKIYPPTN